MGLFSFSSVSDRIFLQICGTIEKNNKRQAVRDINVVRFAMKILATMEGKNSNYVLLEIDKSYERHNSIVLCGLLVSLREEDRLFGIFGNEVLEEFMD